MRHGCFRTAAWLRGARVGLPLVLALGWCGVVSALPVVRMTPGGAWVEEVGGLYRVPAGQAVDWTVTICNDSPGPLTARVLDDVHGGDCPGDPELTVRCPPPAVAGGTVAACGDEGFGTVDVTGVPIDVAGCADVVVRTEVSLLAPVGSSVGNLAFYFTAVESGQTSPPGGSGCSLVEVAPPLPTQLALELLAVPDAPPFAGGDPSAKIVLRAVGRNLSPREIRGDVELPLPPELELIEVVTCPAGATCSEAVPGVVRAADVRVPEGGTFALEVRARGGCATARTPELCAQATFHPVEDRAAVIGSDSDASLTGEQPTCFPVAVEDVVLLKDYDWTDSNGSGGTDAGDRIRYRVLVWNRGIGAAASIAVDDRLPLGLDPATASTDARGSFDLGTGTATWLVSDLGPGSSIGLWLEATMLGASVAPNRARATTALTTSCGLPEILSDDPATAVVGDATGVEPGGRAVARLHKTVDSWDDRDGDGEVGPDEPLVFRLEVTNAGSAPLAGSEVVDLLDACWAPPTNVGVAPPGGGTDASAGQEVRVTGIGGADGLLPGETVTVTFRTSSATPLTCCNQARLEWAATSLWSDDPTTVLLAEDPTCARPAEPAVSLAKRVEILDDLRADGVAQVDERVRYVVTVSNHGDVDLRHGVVSDELPPGVAPDLGTLVAPDGAVPVLVPPPAGLAGAGRLELHGVLVPARGSAVVSFEAVLTAEALGTTCNQASLGATGLVGPLSSADEAGGGATCLDVGIIPRPELVLDLASSGSLLDECALPGEGLTIMLGGLIDGSADASAVTLRLQLDGPWQVVDPDGGVPDAGGLRWDLGTLALGSTIARNVVLGVPCGTASGTILRSAATLSSPDAAAPAMATGDTLEVAAPLLAGRIEMDHADVDADFELDPGEVLAVRVLHDETSGCAALDVAARLVLDPWLSVLSVGDGGVAGTGEVTWTGPVSAPLARVDGGATATLHADLTLRADAPDCARPFVRPEATWAEAPGTGCPELASWSGGRADTPPSACVGSGQADLLRESAVRDLGPVTPPLSALLDPAGVVDTCFDGTVPRIDPANVLLPDVAMQLPLGVELPDEALGGGASPLVLYEVSHSCARIRVCKVDLDGDPGTGAESLRVGATPCVP